jgi:hypothetical protein
MIVIVSTFDGVHVKSGGQNTVLDWNDAWYVPGGPAFAHVKVPNAGFPVVDEKVAPGGPLNISHVTIILGSSPVQVK